MLQSAQTQRAVEWYTAPCCFGPPRRVRVPRCLPKPAISKDPRFSKLRELDLYGYARIVGLDEAGRGALAGPCVVAAVQIQKGHEPISDIQDSKQIKSAKKRQWIYDQVMQDRHVHCELVEMSSKLVDKYNVLEATMMGMRKALRTMDKKHGVDYILVDGNMNPNYTNSCGRVESECIIQGDQHVYIISMASILAKVYRDKIMIDLALKYPRYAFAQNKGYPTKQHTQVIESKGPCREHRRTFAPVSTWLAQHPTKKRKRRKKHLELD